MRYRELLTPTKTFQLGREEMSWTSENGPWSSPTTYNSITSTDMGSLSAAKYCYDELHSGPPFTTGGTFNLWSYADNRCIPTRSCVLVAKSWYGNLWYKYSGSFQTSLSGTKLTDWMTVPGAEYNAGKKSNPNTPNGQSTWGDASAYGAKGWNKFRPAQPGASLGIFLGEAKEIPRMLSSTARYFRDAYVSRFGKSPKGKLKRQADAWLNTQFGWRPFISDLQAFYKTWKNADEMLKQIERDNGQWVRRGGSVTKDRVLTVLESSAATHCSTPSLGAPYYFVRNKPPGNYIVTRVTDTKVWFEGKFRYHIPNCGSVEWRKKALGQLFGLDVNPSLLWELTPWSWLVDWCSNVGTVMSNISPGLAENLAASYAYVMCTKEERVEIASTLNLANGPRTDTWTRSLTRKVREQASPFGFSSTWENFTPRQWSILGALGITRLH